MTKCALPGCNKKARIKFCSNAHKDRFHNINNPRGIYAHLHPSANDPDYDYDDTHPYSSEGLGQD